MYRSYYIMFNVNVLKDVAAAALEEALVDVRPNTMTCSYVINYNIM